MTVLSEFHFPRFEIGDFISLTRSRLLQNSFTYNGVFYKVSDGLAMGNPLSPILTDLYMHYFETKLFDLLDLPSYVLYVDDCSVLLNTLKHAMDSVSFYPQFN